MACRFLFNSLIPSGGITPSSQRSGIVSGAVKDGTGSATMTPSGAYTGLLDLEYTITIDSIAAGAEIGQATFKWKTSADTSWTTGVVTSASNIALSNGISVFWTAGTGDDFVLGDTWYTKGINHFAAEKLLDYDRDTRYRSASLDAPNTLVFDLGSAQAVSALVVYDHNLTSGATLTLEANTADSWGSPAFSVSLTHTADHLVHYLAATQTYRYWRLVMLDESNSDTYIEIGEVFLGGYFEPSRMPKFGGKDTSAAIMNIQESQYGIRKRQFFNMKRTLTLDWKGLTATDKSSMEAILASISDRSSGVINPVYYTDDTNSPENTRLFDVSSFPFTRMEAVDELYLLKAQLAEVLKSV